MPPYPDARTGEWAQGEPESFSIDIASHGLVKAVLPFDFVNTLGQKPCTLCAHFTQPY